MTYIIAPNGSCIYYTTDGHPYKVRDQFPRPIREYIIPEGTQFDAREPFGPRMYRLLGPDWRTRSGWMRRFRASDYTTMAHIMHAAGIFRSVSEARKAGWDRPTTLGTFYVGKGMGSRMVVIEEPPNDG